MKLLKIILVAGLSLATACLGAYMYFVYSPAPALPQLKGSWSHKSLQVDERERGYGVYLPNPPPERPGIVLVLHGSNSSAAQIRQWTGYEFDQLADARGVLVAYPDAYKHTWNECRKAGPYPAKQEKVDDVAFLTHVIDGLVSEYGADASQVFVFGYSNGGQMAMRMALEKPDRVTKFAVVAASWPAADNNVCPAMGPTRPALFINGTRDPISPFGGGEATLFGFASRGEVLPAVKTAQMFAYRNGFEAPTRMGQLPHRHPEDPTRVETRTWAQGGLPYVQQFIVHEGGHVVPQQAFRFPRLLGNTSQDLDAPAEAVKFFMNGAAS